MTNRIEKTKQFLVQKFNENPYYMEHPEERDYRIEHTMRVAHLGEQIAKSEGMDVEVLVIACLLHDVSYCEEFKDEEGWLNHGRRAAEFARPFLLSIELEPEKIQEICYGIAIHVDDKADFDGERTSLAISVGDADNLDRFDVYRIYEVLEKKAYSKMNLTEKKETVSKTLTQIEKYHEMNLATQFATKLWRERIEFYQDFYQKLFLQLKCSEYPMKD